MKFLKQSFLSFAFLLCTLALNAQNAPAGINYQAVLRDHQGQVIADQQIRLRVSVNDPETRNSFYTESHQVTTSNVGIFTVVIGAGKPEKGAFKDIPWSTANTWLEVAYDTDNNGTYEITGTTRMLSVPYAFYAEKAGSAVNGTGPNPTGTEGGGLSEDYWTVKGNSEIDDKWMFLGSQNYADLVIKTHDVERMRITKGIGAEPHDALIDLQEDVTADKSLIVGTTLTVGGVTLLNDDLLVIGSAKVGKDLDVTGNSFLHGGLKVDGTLDVDGDGIINGGLDVQESSEFEKDVKIDHNLYVYNDAFIQRNTDIGNDLHVGHDADIDHNLNVDNDGHFGRDLDVDRNANVDVNLHVGNDADVDHNLNVDNDGHFGRDLDVDRNANVDVNLHVGNDADIDHNLNVDNDTHIGRDLDVDHNVNIDNNLTVQKDAFIKGNLDVDGTGTFLDLHIERDADIDRNLNVDVDVHVGRNLDVDNNINVDGSVHIDVDLDVDNNVNIDKNLTVNNNTTINNDLTVNHNTYINNDLTVNHNTTINNDLTVINNTTINNDLRVTNDVHVGGTLQVENPITANCRLVVNSCVEGDDQNIDNYPVLVQGGSQGIAVKVNGTRGEANNFVSFWDESGIQGRIEGQTYNELVTSFDFIWYNTMQGLHDALAIAMAVACGFQLDFGEVGVWTAEAALITTEWAEYDINITNKVGVAFESGSGDYAEWLERANPAEDFNFGEIVGVRGGKIDRNTVGADHFMVVSKAPIVLGNMPVRGREKDFEKVAFMGQVPVRVMGKVAVGDYILPSGNNDGYGKAVNPAKMRTEDYAKIVGVSWQAGETFPMNVVNVAVGINSNDLASRMTEQQRQIEGMSQEMLQMKAQMNQLFALLGKQSPYEGIVIPVVPPASVVAATAVPATPAPQGLSKADVNQIIESNQAIFVEALAKTRAKLEAKGVDINKFPEIAAIYNNPVQWMKVQNEKGYFDEMFEKAKATSRH